VEIIEMYQDDLGTIIFAIVHGNLSFVVTICTPRSACILPVFRIGIDLNMDPDPDLDPGIFMTKIKEIFMVNFVFFSHKLPLAKWLTLFLT